ncbi:monooxygenase [Phlyctema vagabunda]|uniref:Monooxygenase n=1 Tax=Phlyctema vagabunda TaxID=108571 RepID=A0ABR4PA24_9HELO
MPSSLKLIKRRYWDWTLDSADPARSSIWDAETGFGGNGNPEDPARCVTDGPFRDIRPDWLEGRYQPHCLSRAFNDGNGRVGRMFGEEYSPEAIEAVQANIDFTTFATALENGPHGAVHTAIDGDMSTSTSPNEILFFLHHCQVDRLWYLWQQVDPLVRNLDYGGDRTQDVAGRPPPQPATVEDLLRMNNLAPDLRVRDLLTTESDLLCYVY